MGEIAPKSTASKERITKQFLCDSKGGWERREGVRKKKRQYREPVSRTGGDYGLIKRARPDRPLPCPAESDANKQRRLHLAADNAADVVPFLFIYFIF